MFKCCENCKWYVIIGNIGLTPCVNKKSKHFKSMRSPADVCDEWTNDEAKKGHHGDAEKGSTAPALKS